MVADNLLDLSHAPYLHPFLTPKEAPPPEFRIERDLRQDGDTVWSMHCNLNSRITPLLAVLWPDSPPLIEGYFDMRWQPPSNLLMVAGAAVMDTQRQEGAAIPMAHLLTPVDEHTTHYFWSQARNRMVGIPAVDEQVRIGINHAFEHEDEAMMAECYALMGTADLMSLKPVLLPGDGPALRTRRILARRIEAEISVERRAVQLRRSVPFPSAGPRAAKLLKAQIQPLQQLARQWVARRVASRDFGAQE
jgi:vanillate O-demethylase monooxygenase subunit